MSYEHLIWERDGAVGRVTLNRPDSLNSWTGDFGRELKQVVEHDAADPDVRAVLELEDPRVLHLADDGDFELGSRVEPKTGVRRKRQYLRTRRSLLLRTRSRTLAS
jgi:1,4-dihydroxy-2-naphthoyl-CoA synthase